MPHLNVIQQLIIWAPPVIFAITVHEVSHGWMAGRLGDPTARMLGRLTLNPIKHIDPLGTVLLPAILLVLGGIVFGWAKPVPITPQNFSHPRRDMAIVGAAGPMANLLMAFLWAMVMRLAAIPGVNFGGVATVLYYMGIAGVEINVFLMLLNLLPLPPLDGGRVLAGILPGRLAAKLDRVEPYGFLILILLLVLLQQSAALRYLFLAPVILVVNAFLALGGWHQIPGPLQ